MEQETLNINVTCLRNQVDCLISSSTTIAFPFSYHFCLLSVFMGEYNLFIKCKFYFRLWCTLIILFSCIYHYMVN